LSDRKPEPYLLTQPVLTQPVSSPGRAVLPVSKQQALAVQFVDQARGAMLEGKPIDTRLVSVMTILRDLPARRHLLVLFRTSDKAMVEAATDFFSEIAKQQERGARDADRKVSLIDRAGLAVAASVGAGGLGLCFSIGPALGPIAMFCGGLIGIVLSAAGRHILAQRVDLRREEALDIREFVSDLRKIRDGME